MVERFWLAFLPLFVAFDALGVLPLFWTLSEGLSAEQRRQAIHKAAMVGAFVGPVFLLVSAWVLDALGIEMADVMIAGGAILFALALSDLLRTEQIRSSAAEDLGAVPLGVPLIVGPAVLATLLLARQRSGVWMTLAAFNLNMLLTWFILLTADWLVRWVGRDGARVVSKVFNLVLASFAVMLIRLGIATLLAPRQ